jgi:hypothetical protein
VPVLSRISIGDILASSSSSLLALPTLGDAMQTITPDFANVHVYLLIIEAKMAQYLPRSRIKQSKDKRMKKSTVMPTIVHAKFSFVLST